jgi:serine/threonine protein kinase
MRYRASVTTSASPPDPNASKALRGGRYALIRKLGEGSQGETYEAMDNGVGPEARKRAARETPLVDKWARYVREQETGGEVKRDAKLVAIKCFRVGTAKTWKDVELAEREARTLASLAHPRLPKYFEHFEEDGALYLVMEKIEGESLASLRKQGRTMNGAEITRMLEDIGGALRYLHGRAPPVVHRDIKPGNIIRRPDGSFALVDFGAVRDRLRPAGGSTVVGTFGFMAPEQFQGRASAASDVYGLGATALTMLTGVEPEDLPHEGLGINVRRALPRGTPGSLARARGHARSGSRPAARVGR